MDAHPLRGLHRWLGLPLLCAVSGGAAGLLSDLTSDSEFSWALVSMGAGLGVGIGISGSLTSIPWLNVVLSPVLTWICVVVGLGINSWNSGSIGWAIMIGLFWLPGMRLAVFLFTVPAAAMQAWRWRRGRPRLLSDLLVAALVALAIELGLSVGTGNGWTLRGSETVFLVLFFQGNVLATEVALRLSARKTSASPR